MYFIVYKTTNKINSKIYIGVHQTKDLNDGYLGSGTLLQRAIKKYGIENFSKEILFSFNNIEDMFKKETELVNEEFLKRNDIYNILIGGSGGWDYVNNLGHNKNFNFYENQDIVKKSKTEFFENKEKVDLWKKRISNSIKEKYNSGYVNPNFGKKHSEFAKEKMKNLGNHKGSKNSQFGTCWITKGTESKKIKKEDLYLWLEQGYNKGRKL